MRSLPLRLAGLPAALALVLGALAADAGELRFRGQNQNLEEARALVGKARFEEALEELKTAEALPGNTNRHLADLYMLRAGALLGLAPEAERTAQAKDALVKLFHVDAEGASLSGATDAVKALAQQLKTQRPILLHDRLVTVRSGRPMRLRARLLSAPANAQLFVRYRTEPDGDVEGNGANADLALSLLDPGQYVKVALDPRGADSFEVFLRPGVGGVPADGEHVMRYYLEAYDEKGEKGGVLDRNGTAQEQIGRAHV